MIGRGGVVRWEGGGLGQGIMPGENTGGIDPTQPIGGALSVPIGGAGITLSPGVTIPNPFASWGSGEWVVAILGAFAVYALLHTAGEGVGGFSSWRKKRRSTAQRRSELEAELRGL